MENFTGKPKLDYKKQNFNKFKNIIGKLPPEDKQKALTNVKKAKYSNNIYSSLIQEVNEDNKRWMESGADPSWVLQMSAEAYAEKAFEQRDPNILGLIETINTKYGNYAQTKKGKDLIYQYNNRISSVLDAEERANKTYKLDLEKQEKQNFREKANTVVTNYRIDPSEENKREMELLQKQSELAGFDTILSNVIRNIDTIREATSMTFISNTDFPEEIGAVIKDPERFILGNDLESSVGDVEMELLRQGKVVKPEQRPLLKQVISAYTNTDVVPFYKSSLDNISEDIKNVYKSIATENQKKDLAPSVAATQVVNSLISRMEESFTEAYRDHLEKATQDYNKTQEEPFEGLLPFKDWLPQNVAEFKEELENLTKTVFTRDSDNRPSDMYTQIKEAYESDLPTSSPESLNQYLDRLKERRGRLLTGRDLTEDEKQLTTEEKEDLIKAIGEELLNYDAAYENSYRKSRRLSLTEEKKKLVNSLQWEVDLENKSGKSKGAKSLLEFLKNNAGNSTRKIKQGLLELKLLHNLEFSKDIDDYTSNFAEAAKPYTDLEIFKTAESEYKNIIRDEFPGFKLGLLSSPSFGLDTELKLSPVETAQRKLIIATANKVRDFIELEKFNKERELGEPYDLWDKDDKMEFDDRLYKAIFEGEDAYFGKNHIDTLIKMKSKSTSTSDTGSSTGVIEYSTPEKIFRSLFKVRDKAQREKRIKLIKNDKVEHKQFFTEVSKKLNSLGKRSFTDLYNSIIPEDSEQDFDTDYKDNPAVFRGLSKSESLKKWQIYQIMNELSKSIMN